MRLDERGDDSTAFRGKEAGSTPQQGNREQTKQRSHATADNQTQEAAGNNVVIGSKRSSLGHKCGKEENAPQEREQPHKGRKNPRAAHWTKALPHLYLAGMGGYWPLMILAASPFRLRSAKQETEAGWADQRSSQQGQSRSRGCRGAHATASKEKWTAWRTGESERGR